MNTNAPLKFLTEEDLQRVHAEMVADVRNEPPHIETKEPRLLIRMDGKIFRYIGPADG